jgi:hypothetical protein
MTAYYSHQFGQTTTYKSGGGGVTVNSNTFLNPKTFGGVVGTTTSYGSRKLSKLER